MGFFLITLSTGFVLVVVAEVVLIQFSHQVFLFAKLLLHITYYDKILTEATLRQICCNHIWINALHPDTKRNQRDIGNGQKKHIAFCFSWSVILFRSEPFLGGTLNRDYSEILHRWQSSFLFFSLSLSLGSSSLHIIGKLLLSAISSTAWTRREASVYRGSMNYVIRIIDEGGKKIARLFFPAMGDERRFG